MNHQRPTPHIIPNDECSEDHPFDETSVKQQPKRLRPFYFQTSACLRALAGTTRVQPHAGGLVPVVPKPTSKHNMVVMKTVTATATARPKSPPLAATHDCQGSDCLPCSDDHACGPSVEHLSLLSCNGMDLGDCGPSPLPVIRQASSASSNQVVHSAITIGPPQYKVFQTRLPDVLLPLLPAIMVRSEEHAMLRPGGWQTYLYSLTKQDLPLAEIPGGMTLVQPLTDFVVWSLQQLYTSRSLSGAVPMIRMDANQPHVLKYDAQHKGVPLHHDRCDVTAQLMLSRSSDYVGGGTYFCDMDQTIRLERGELLFHPGSLVHSGRDIMSGSRLLLVWFVHLR